MEVKTYLLLLLLHFCKSVSLNQGQKDINVIAESLCKGKICSVSPENLLNIQDIITSNRLIILDGVEFRVNGKSDIIVIENVSNLTISGGEGGSIIQCSSQSCFGLHLKNVTNVSLTGIRIRDCGCTIDKYTIFDVYIVITKISILVEASKNVILSHIHIQNSPGVALALIDLSPSDAPSKSPFFLGAWDTNPKVTLNDCNVSNSREGSVVVHGNTSVLIQRTVIAHSGIGLAFYSETDVLMRNIDVINCRVSYLEGRSAMVREKLTMDNSSLYVTSQVLYIYGSSVSFIGDAFTIGLVGTHCEIVISENSVVRFTKFNITAMNFVAHLEDSEFQLDINSSLIFINNRVNNDTSLLSLYRTYMWISNNSSLILTRNWMESRGQALVFIDSAVETSRGKLLLEQNECYNSSVFIMSGIVAEVTNGSIVCITRNEMYNGSSIFVSTGGSKWSISSDSQFLITENLVFNGFSVFFEGNVTFGGLVRVAGNNVSHYGALNLFDSHVKFTGVLEVVENRGESGGLAAYNSKVGIADRATFTDNQATNGGAMTLISSFLYVAINATVEFTRNQADELGGAIYISKPRQDYMCDVFTTNSLPTCSVRVWSTIIPTCEVFSITFNQNKAGIAGSAIYGGQTSACLPTGYACYSKCPFPTITDMYQYNGVNDSSDLSDFTSDPTRACFCENGLPNCYNVVRTITVHPGEQFILSLAIVGYGLGTVPGSVIARVRGENVILNNRQTLLGSELEYSQEIGGRECQDVGYSITSERDSEFLALAVDTQSFVKTLEEAQEVVRFQQTRKERESEEVKFPVVAFPSFGTFFHIPVFVELDLLPCPVGFQLVNGICICHQILRENGIHSCSFSNGTALILRPAPYWIFLPINTNSSILIHPNCPYDYCQSEDMNITAESPNTQCQYQRSGVLCGSCHEGLSMILGSSECKTCSNLYLVSITAFILMGVALVTLVILLNMTVSVGTLNGLILFANIL